MSRKNSVFEFVYWEPCLRTLRSTFRPKFEKLQIEWQNSTPCFTSLLEMKRLNIEFPRVEIEATTVAFTVARMFPWPLTLLLPSKNIFY